VGLLTYRAATLDDVALLVRWHADPEVARYWDNETFSEEQMRHRLEREAVDAWIVAEDGVSVGYLQSWWEDDAPKRGGLDGFLIPSARGRGIMPAVARQLAERLLADGWEYVTVDPYVWNARAIRAWQNAGFAEISRDEKIVLMRFVR
jgi:aminoglycoside 6'-N-acetyltransferase